MIAWVEVWMQARWQRLAGYSLVRAMAWKGRVDRRRARPMADDVAIGGPAGGTVMRRHTFRFRWINRYDDCQRMQRLARVVWQRGTVGDGAGYSVKLSVGLRPCLWRFQRELCGLVVTVAGVRVHYVRSYGGINV